MNWINNLLDNHRPTGITLTRVFSALGKSGTNDRAAINVCIHRAKCQWNYNLFELISCNKKNQIEMGHHNLDS